MASGFIGSYNGENWRCFMGTVIYSTSPLWAFSNPLLTVLFTACLGAAGLAASFFQRKQGKGARIAMAASGTVLILFSAITAVIFLVSITSGADTVAAHLNEKSVAVSNCGDSGSTCTDYILETTVGPASYDFVVNSKTYDLAQVGACYRVTFYRSKSITDPVADTNTYHRIATITRIETTDPTACQ